jgi:hypothetical protein
MELSMDSTMLKSFEDGKMKGMPKLSPCEEGVEGCI